MNPDEVTSIRRKLAEVEFRAKADESFLAQLQEDPIGILRSEGFDDPVARELASQLQGEYEEAADEARPMCSECDPFTCLVTGCCYWTTVPPTEPSA
jgi:hypothetical protein